MSRTSKQKFWTKLRALGYGTYGDYLQSLHWRDVRSRFIRSKLFKGKCERCQRPIGAGTDQVAFIHHRSYERLGAEHLRDLAALCADCHAVVHATDDGYPHRGLWRNAKKAIRSRRVLPGQSSPSP
jgi:5-methylcytosine-specific restriction endonuclease McrA